MAKKTAKKIRRKPAKKKPSKKVAKKRPAKKAPAKARKKVSKKVAKKASKKRPAKKAKAASEPVELTRRAEWSISQFWLNTGFARETIRKRFAEAGLKPSRKVKGYPVYLASDGLPVLYYTQDGEIDPDKLKPFERRAYYQGELDKLKLQAERGELVPAFEVEAAQGRFFKIVVRHAETLPDVLERDIGLTPRQLDRVQKHMDELRDAMYREIVDIDADADSAAEISA